jgi:hypothetical protein
MNTTPGKPLSAGATRKVKEATLRVLGDMGEQGPPGFGDEEEPSRFRVRLASSTRPDATYKWEYSGYVQRKVGGGYGMYEDDPAFPSPITLFNLPEDDNGEDGVLSGYDTDANQNIVGILPVADGTIVEAWIEYFNDDMSSGGENESGWEYRFSQRNDPIVECQFGASSS